MHGLGADGEDFVPIVKELRLPVAVRYIFPHAPQRQVSINGGMVMRAWFDIFRPDINAQPDIEGIRASQNAIEALIAQQAALGIATENIFLAGFSQGGAIALHTAMGQTAPLAGVLALSTYLPLASDAQPNILPAATRTPIFMVHGRHDTVIPYSSGSASRDKLIQFCYSVEWHEYPMAHTVCEPELRDIETWLSAQLLK